MNQEPAIKKQTGSVNADILRLCAYIKILQGGKQNEEAEYAENGFYAGCCYADGYVYGNTCLR